MSLAASLARELSRHFTVADDIEIVWHTKLPRTAVQDILLDGLDLPPAPDYADAREATFPEMCAYFRDYYGDRVETMVMPCVNLEFYEILFFVRKQTAPKAHPLYDI